MSERCVYIICAHSDDQTLGPGGTAAKYAREGIDVHTIIMSYGEFSHPWMQGHVTVKTRVKEAQKADKIIGGKSVTFLGLKEGEFEKGMQDKHLYIKLRKKLNERKPEKIFTHSLNDPLPDHRATHNIVKKLVKKMRTKPAVYSFDIWNVIAIRKRNRPKLVVDTSDTFKIKVKALLCFKSQRLSVYQILPRIALYNLLDGIQHGMKFAEKFRRVDIDED
jgi:LmbE family N-acetylglucosaminyl deacetylase